MNLLPEDADAADEARAAQERLRAVTDIVMNELAALILDFRKRYNSRTGEYDDAILNLALKRTLAGAACAQVTMGSFTVDEFNACAVEAFEYFGSMTGQQQAQAASAQPSTAGAH